MLIAVTRLPPRTEAVAEAARATGLAAVDLRGRLAGLLPRVLLAEGDPARAAAIAAALNGLGFGVLVCDPALVPGDDDRLLGRTLDLGGGGLGVLDGRGHRHEIPPAALTLIQRGVRRATRTTTTTSSSRRLDVGRAVLTGGLMMTKKVEKTETATTTAHEPFLCLHRSDGGQDVILYERRLDYQFLDAVLQPSSLANFETTLARLRALAPAAAFDDRLAQTGFLAGIRYTSADPVDVGLFLVHMAHLAG